MTINSGESRFATLNYDSLKPYTRFPFVLVVSQAETEKKLRHRFESLGRKIFRPYRAVGLKASEKRDGVDVLFESGETINAKYVLGADGAKSVVCYLSKRFCHILLIKILNLDTNYKWNWIFRSRWTACRKVCR